MNAKKDEGPKTLGGYVVMVLGAVLLFLLLVFGLLSSGRPI